MQTATQLAIIPNVKPDNGVYAQTFTDSVEIEGRLDGRAVVRAKVEPGREPAISIVSVRTLNPEQAGYVRDVIAGVLFAIDAAVKAFERVNAAPVGEVEQ
jgi:hypothetical protein